MKQEQEQKTEQKNFIENSQLKLRNLLTIHQIILLLKKLKKKITLARSTQKKT